MSVSSSLPTLYDILGVSCTANATTIRHAYLWMSKQTHPDRSGMQSVSENGTDENSSAHHDDDDDGKAMSWPYTFEQIHHAYTIVGDPERRRQYDREQYTTLQCQKQMNQMYAAWSVDWDECVWEWEDDMENQNRNQNQNHDTDEQMKSDIAINRQTTQAITPTNTTTNTNTTNTANTNGYHGSFECRCGQDIRITRQTYQVACHGCSMAYTITHQ